MFVKHFQLNVNNHDLLVCDKEGLDGSVLDTPDLLIQDSQDQV